MPQICFALAHVCPCNLAAAAVTWRRIQTNRPCSLLPPPRRPPASRRTQACAAGGQLRELRLQADCQLTVSPDALGPLCSSLERLSLQACSRSHESASTAIYAFGLEALTALRELELVGRCVRGCSRHSSSMELRGTFGG